jgi:hypothetical protein
VIRHNFHEFYLFCRQQKWNSLSCISVYWDILVSSITLLVKSVKQCNPLQKWSLYLIWVSAFCGRTQCCGFNKLGNACGLFALLLPLLLLNGFSAVCKCSCYFLLFFHVELWLHLDCELSPAHVALTYFLYLCFEHREIIFLFCASQRTLIMINCMNVCRLLCKFSVIFVQL